MTIQGLKRKVSFFIINHFLVSTNKRVFGVKRYLLNWSGVKIGENSKIVGPIYISGNLNIGNNVWIGANFCVRGNGVVTIEDNCDIAPDVSFVTGSHEIGPKERRAGIGFNKDIKVGSGTWIGAYSKILGGVNIERGCVIAAGSVVNKNVSENLLVGGVPTRIIRELSEVDKDDR
ncbi:transferase [Turicibacter sanguinis]|uniref:acyltransferase n=1 Tax=Turicibacter sanguinis TaxID=154288 RepID=UPI0012BD3682|nr:DapH/DapD/GlmU-related protein [Turicibacter sanguinis]MDB8545640.1 DapH/DapD/GlmU-related protein [Turicibacter sanguinis]MTO10812.1 transferase [Turicibacter sanguinis]MTP48347.1 transferase [Turicibacter sanguinis]MTP51066.1 transferase [Turicibacter sanguinis]MTQ08348.1 transferase [Turicibacter sanguinis]